MRTEEAVKILEACREIPYFPKEAFTMAIDIMRHKQPNENLLSLDELREMAKEGEYFIGDGKSYFEPGVIRPVYLEAEVCSYGSVTFDDGTPQIWWVGWDIPDKMIAEEYGKTWFAYRVKPCEDGGVNNETD